MFNTRSAAFASFLLSALVGCGGDRATQATANKEAARVFRGGTLYRITANESSIGIDSGVAELIAREQKDVLAAVAGTSDSGRRQLAERFAQLTSDQFAITGQTETKSLNGMTLTHLELTQLHHGIPVENAWLSFTFKPNQRGATALATSGYQLYPQISADTTPSVSMEAAVDAARKALGTSERETPGSGLVIADIDGVLRLVYRITVDGSSTIAMVMANGEDAGTVALRDGRIFDVQGQVTGHFVRGGAPGSAIGQIVNEPLPYVQLDHWDEATMTTIHADAQGRFAFPARGIVTTGSLIGYAASLQYQELAALNGESLEIAFGSDTEEDLADVTAYRFIELAAEFLRANGLTLQGPTPVNSNLQETCNAFYDSINKSLNFFHSGGGCNNSAIDTIVVHEYGHAVDDQQGGIREPGLSEGWGDLIACFALDNPELGKGLKDDGTLVRSCDNDYQFPIIEKIDEAHRLGQAWSGFGWHAREGLIAAYGKARGDEIARALFLPSLASNAIDIPTATREVFLRDDDDGDLTNGTPHWAILIEAAHRHSLDYVADFVGPAPISDLRVTSSTATTMMIEWTDTGDDGTSGKVTQLELRYSLEPLSSEHWERSALHPTSLSIQPGGTRRQATIPIMPGAVVYLALGAMDDASSWSTSNVVRFTTPQGSALFEEGVEAGQGAWSFGCRSYRTDEGGECEPGGRWQVGDSGNYPQGRQGFHWDGWDHRYEIASLTSPILDLRLATAPVLDFFESFDHEYAVREVVIANVDDPEDWEKFSQPEVAANSAQKFKRSFVPLANFVGKRVRVSFLANTNSLGGVKQIWDIDNIRVLDDCASCQSFKRTVIFLHKQTVPGQDLFFRGGIDFDYSRNVLHRTCTVENGLCAIPIRHRASFIDPTRARDLFLDWHGAEPNQGNVAGSPLAWTTNRWPPEWGAEKTVLQNGYGQEVLNSWGDHYWMLDVDMDCSRTVNGWFEFKGFLTNSSDNGGWERNVSQAGAPYPSGNHFGQCGKINVFDWSSGRFEARDF